MADSNPNPQPQVETPPNPQPQVETPPPPKVDNADKGSNFDPDSFFNKLDTQLKGFGEQMVSSIKEAFPAPEPPKEPPKADPPKSDPEPPKGNPEPGGGHLPRQQRFVQWWFGK